MVKKGSKCEARKENKRQLKGEMCHAVKIVFPNYACSTLFPKYQNIPEVLCVNHCDFFSGLAHPWCSVNSTINYPRQHCYINFSAKVSIEEVGKIKQCPFSLPAIRNFLPQRIVENSRRNADRTKSRAVAEAWRTSWNKALHSVHRYDCPDNFFFCFFITSKTPYFFSPYKSLHSTWKMSQLMHWNGQR